MPARETPAGLVPRDRGLRHDRPRHSPRTGSRRLFEVKIKDWKTEVDGIRDFLKPYKGRLPAEIREQYEKLERQVRWDAAPGPGSDRPLVRHRGLGRAPSAAPKNSGPRGA